MTLVTIIFSKLLTDFLRICFTKVDPILNPAREHANAAYFLILFYFVFLRKLLNSAIANFCIVLAVFHNI